MGNIEKPSRTFEPSDSAMIGPVAQAVLDSLPTGVIVVDPNLRIIAANLPAARLINVADTIDRSLAQGTGNTESSQLDWAEKLRDALSTGQARSFENVCYNLHGRAKFLRIVCNPIEEAGEQKHAVGAVVTLEDTGERVHLQKELANAERLATLGKLTSKIAHELNSPLDGILRYISLALRAVEKEGLDKPQEYLTRCQQGLMRMVHILSELLEFSRISRAPVEYAPIEQIVEEAIKIMSAKAETSRVQILRDYAKDMPQIRSGNLFQVFCNIIKNAFDAMPDEGQLHISTRMAPDNTVVIEFRDTGIGFAPENAEAIFRPFFTTKDKGTGLGLAICRDIVERYNGRITAENAPERGSIFSVYLPLANEPQEPYGEIL